MYRIQEAKVVPLAQKVVSAYNEWDPLEEAIVGVADGAHVPQWHVALRATMPEAQWDFFKQRGGQPWPQDEVDAARWDLDGLCKVLEREGVVVRRPDIPAAHAPFRTPYFESASGLYAAMPRDIALVVGDEIIEAPMAWRSRYFELDNYRALFSRYFHEGARWVSPPRPRMADALYVKEFVDPAPGEAMRYAITEEEPVFDAADFVRFGTDIFVQRSNVTNGFGIEWMRRHLAPTYRVHELTLDDTHPMHIDASITPLAPGKLLVNPERVSSLPRIFKDWEVRHAPPPVLDPRPLRMSSAWISMNLLSIDERRVLVEEEELPLQAMLKGWGMQPIPVPFRRFNVLGGSFHCAVLDVRRRGRLQSYF